MDVLLDRARYEKVASIIREAIDRYVPRTGGRRTATARRILAAGPAPSPAVPDLLEELDGLRSRRG